MLELRAVDEGAVPASAPATSRLFVLPVAARRWVSTDNSVVLDLKILMYRNADEIEKLKKIKEDSDREAASMLQQLNTLSEYRDSM